VAFCNPTLPFLLRISIFACAGCVSLCTGSGERWRSGGSKCDSAQHVGHSARSSPQSLNEWLRWLRSSPLSRLKLTSCCLCRRCELLQNREHRERVCGGHHWWGHTGQWGGSRAGPRPAHFSALFRRKDDRFARDSRRGCGCHPGGCIWRRWVAIASANSPKSRRGRRALGPRPTLTPIAAPTPLAAPAPPLPLGTGARGISSKAAGFSRVTAVLGAQWGDEGKGKLADVLAKECVAAPQRAESGENRGRCAFCWRYFYWLSL
jgi:hypothetical protein